MNYIYHIINSEEWEQISEMNYYAPSSLVSEGFIHFSYKDQINDVLQRFYKQEDDLMVIKVDINKLESELKIEEVLDHGHFPHLYGQLNLNAVVETTNVFNDNQGMIGMNEEFKQERIISFDE